MVSCGDIFWKTTLWIEDLPDLSKETDSAMTGMGSKRISTKQRACIKSVRGGKGSRTQRLQGGGKRLVREARRGIFLRCGSACYHQDVCSIPLRPHEEDLGLYFGFAFLFDIRFRIHVVFSCSRRVLKPRRNQMEAHGI